VFINKTNFIILFFFCLSFSNVVNGETTEEDLLKKKTKLWFEKHPDSYPHWITPEEINIQNSGDREFYETDPPSAPVINIPEYAPMEGVLIRYPFGISYTVIAEMSENTVVTTIVSSDGQQSYVINQYTNNGVNLNNCNFLVAQSNSYWTRDYGPWYIINGNNELGIVNFPYNRPRPFDNDIPIEVAEFLGLELYGMNVITAGGNYMTDGMGIAASSTLIFDENPSQTQYQIRDKFEEYLGIFDYDVVEDPNNTYIDHIDCWAKYLDVDKILIRSVQNSHPQYDEIEDVVDYFSNQVTGYNTPYEIYRVYTPQNQPYTNSIILNEKVLVPVTGSSWDDDALAVYEQAMPGYEVVGLTGSWESTDALHCRTKGIADREMIYISHIPISGEVEPVEGGIEINANMIPVGGEPASDIFAEIRYRYNDSSFQSAELNWIFGNEFIGTIPTCSEDCEISYYIRTINELGTTYHHPYIGEPDPHIFYIINPEIQLTVSYGENWNLLGNPVYTQSNHVNDIFPLSTDNTLYTFGSSGYIAQSNMEPGIGYWLHFSEVGLTTITGLPIYEQSLNLMEGWNLISGISLPISTTQIYDSDNILVPNTFYGYESGAGYVNSDEIIPGYGYWVRTTSQGDIVLNSNQQSSIKNIVRDKSADWISINGIKLYLDLNVSSENQLSYSLPPKPPSGGADVRFRGDMTYCDDLGIIEVQSNQNILNVEFNISSSEIPWKLTNTVDEHVLVLKNKGQAFINKSELFKIEKQSTVPVILELYYNYPNPFNSTTSIRFDLTKSEVISLDIFDISGHYITNLKKGYTQRGNYSIEWDGEDSEGNSISAGIYFCTLSFENKNITHKIILLK
tara:strand:- start:32362 stop:34911 length:2550 start_codon:yes stop_codon:yes gene_type:complete